MVTDGSISFAIFVYDDLTRLVNEASFFPRIAGIDVGNGVVGSSATYFYTSLTNYENVMPYNVYERNDSIFYRIDGL